MPKPLTAAAVAKYRPGLAKRRRIVRDGGARSLFLVIAPSGHKSWLMRFRTSGGRIGKMTLGPVDLAAESALPPVIGMPLTLAAARQLAAQVQRERALGHDPVADHKARRGRQQAAAIEGAASTFGVAARDFIEQYSMRRVRRWKEQARLLGLQPTPDGKLEVISGGLAQRWAAKPLSEIDGHDIYGVIAETRERGAPGLERRSDGPTEARARAMLSCLSRMWRWLLQHRRVAHNPCGGVHRPEPPRARERVLTADEIKAFWRATDAKGIGPTFGAVLKLLLLTGCRLKEIAALRRDELNGGAQIELPGTRTKNHRPHVVPLAPLARETISAVPRLDGCPFVFSLNGRTPVSVGSKIKARLDTAMGNPSPWRIHDLRRTAVTGMAELGIRPDVIELCVNHVSGQRGGIAGVYNKSELLPARVEALARWAQHVQGVVQVRANVVALKKARKGNR